MRDDRIAEAIDLAYGYYLSSTKKYTGCCPECGEGYENEDEWEDDDTCICGASKEPRFTAGEFAERCLSDGQFARRWGVRAREA